MAKRPESRWFLAVAYTEMAVGLFIAGLGGSAFYDRASRRIPGAAGVVVGLALVALGARGLYRWRVRKRNGHIGR